MLEKLEAGDTYWLSDDIEQVQARSNRRSHLAGEGSMSGLRDGLSFVQAVERDAPQLWGAGNGQVIWPAGEPLYVVGPTGVGKTTVMGQMTLGRLGLLREVLGMSIERDERPVLYVAADRQIARSLKRMIEPADHETLRDRLKVWEGPLPFTLNGEPDELVKFVLEHGAGTLFLDSLKDVALDLTKDDAASRVSRSLQKVIAAGIEIATSHHQRKQQQGAGKPKSIDDVYGNQALMSGAGSVILLWGKPGDPVVEFTHLKQPMEEVGPLQVVLDHVRGRSRVVDQPNVVDVLRSNGTMTARATAALLFGNDDPSPAEVEKARRRLEAAVERRELCLSAPGTSRHPTIRNHQVTFSSRTSR
jgi:replicative DNA helicase